MSIEQAKAFLDGCNQRHHEAGPWGTGEPITLEEIMGALIGVGYAVIAVAEQLAESK